ncbi:MAG: diguanylate cyclase [Sulfurimonas sp.]
MNHFSHIYKDNEILEDDIKSVEQKLVISTMIYRDIVAKLIMALLVVYILHHDVPDILIYSWTILLAISLSVRLIMTSSYKNVTAETITKWKKYFIGSSLLSGITWGIVSLLLVIYTAGTDMLIIAFILGTMAAGSMMTIVPFRWNYPAFILPMLTPMVIYMLLQQNVQMNIIALIIAGMIVIMIDFARYYRRLQFDNELSIILTRRMKNDLRDAKQKLMDIANSMNEGVLVLNRNGALSFMNREAECLLGYNFKELSNNPQNIYINLRVASEEGAEKSMVRRACDNGGRTHSDNAMLKAKDGHKFPISLTLSPLQSEEGNKGTVILFHDISERKKLEKELRKMALHDRLTGLYNRRIFDDKIEDEVKRTERYEKNLSLLMIDIDHFKKINDTYGHQAGDEVLKHLATIIVKSIRNSDYAARYGGDEFTVTLPETTLEQAAVMAERTREAIASTQLTLLSHTDKIHLTVSVGVSTYRENSSVEELINAADTALYKAKKSGRNQVQKSL